MSEATWRYVHLSADERDNKELCQRAWRIQAQSYYEMGFVHASAITDEGYLSTEIDKSRGAQTDYYLAINPHDDSQCASMRKIHIPKGGDCRDLPAYELCEHTLFPSGSLLLQNIQDADKSLKELGALSRSKHADPLIVHEMFRRVLHESLGKDETWFCAIVSLTYEALIKNYGVRNFAVIGGDVAIDDARVRETVALKPVLVKPDEFIDNILEAYLESGQAPRLRRSFLFFTDGLDDGSMSLKAWQKRQEILEQGDNNAILGGRV